MSNVNAGPIGSPQNIPPKQSMKSGESGIDCVKAFTFLFDSANWVQTWLFCTLVALIPVIGPMVLWGYQVESTELLVRNPGQKYPDFDFNKFGDYLTRGVWPFLVGLACSLVLIPVYLIIYLLPIFGMAMGEAVAIGFLGLGVLVIIVLSIGIGIVTQPMMLRAAMTKNFQEGFKLDFVKDYLGRVWKDLVVGVILVTVGSILISFLGFLALCVGQFFAISLTILAYGHLHYQLYRLYLERGGQPIPYQP